MTGPLSGLKVVELAGIGPAPFCGMFLADLGADVVRVDRRRSPGISPVPPRLDLLNRGKRSIALDLKEPADLAVALDLAARADVLLEGYRPGVAERLGIGPDACLARQPRLVYGRMTGWGQDGPRAQTAGHDITYLAVSGVLHGIGRADGPPQIPVNLLGDFAGGAMYLAAGVLAALWGGGGQVVDAAIVDGAAHLSTMLWGFMAGGAWRDRRGMNLLDSGAPFYDVYATADGRHMAVGPLEPQFFAEFMTRLGLPAEPSYLDPAGWPVLRSALSTAFGTRTQAEWAEVFAGSDACVEPVLPMRSAARDEHLASRGTYVEHDGVLQPAPAPRFSGTPAALSRPPAEPDEHRAEILHDWLGITPPKS